MSPERDPFEITPQPISSFRSKVREQHFPEASRRLIKPTKKVVETAMKLIKQGEVDDKYAQSVFVFDSRLEIVYRLSDADIRDHENESDQPHDYPGLNSGLIIGFINTAGEETDTINIPRQPELVTRENLYPVQEFTPSIMRSLAKSLERSRILYHFNPTQN